MTMRPFEVLAVRMGNGMGAMVEPWHDGERGGAGRQNRHCAQFIRRNLPKKNSAPFHRWKGALPFASVKVPG